MRDPQLRHDEIEKIRRIAERHGFGEDAGRVMALAIAAGGGSMAQFNHPELGGMGQWTRGGMLMIGAMFDDALKARVRALADELAGSVAAGDLPDRMSADQTAPGSVAPSRNWWPNELGQPTSSGAQNGCRYAVFPNLRRLAVEQDGRTTVYDTGDHRIGGASQQQGSRSDLSFSSQHGTVRLEDLPIV
ncbi:SHOCT domain-containing protein [Aureimonas leprariae]|uniref:SHOCT domain-containing protein n=1 Tax=Plantimonas leprariae TaxID=2615207 RepID=A0A7V7PKB7_9HYPH|nr:SHOCT domain-containing protein [Aureimonas leprariae]KAB0676025.1 SHOCT domain-containing protein [Aureimonas leprariae]